MVLRGRVWRERKACKQVISLTFFSPDMEGGGVRRMWMEQSQHEES
jgi:hypothetical protein